MNECKARRKAKEGTFASGEPVVDLCDEEVICKW
jgi:hypothetical protein